MIRRRMIARLTAPLADLVRWGEPWDVEDEPDPLLDPGAALFGAAVTRRAS